MFFKRSPGKNTTTDKDGGASAEKRGPRLKGDKSDPEVRRALFYMYVIIGSQLGLLFVVIIVLMFMGKVITTPWWVFALLFAAVAGGCVYAWHRVRSSIRNITTMAKEMNLSGRNFEISILGGAFSLRVEQDTGRLLEAPPGMQEAGKAAIEAPSAGGPQQPKGT